MSKSGFIACAIASVLSQCSLRVYSGWLDPRFDLAGANGTILSLVEFRGSLYAVGNFTRIAGVNAPGVARWDQSKWEPIQPPLSNSVMAAVATDEAIYFALGCCQVNGPAGLAQWDGQNWTVLGTPQGYRDVMAHVLLLSGTEIYTEVFPEPGSSGLNANKALAKYNRSGWSILAPTSSIGGSGLLSLAFAQGELYGSGALYDPANLSQTLNLGRLVPPKWAMVGGGVNYGLSVFDLASDGTNLLIQGQFTQAGGNPAEGFAVWDGAKW